MLANVLNSISQVESLIRESLKVSSSIWISVDETTDSRGRAVANVLMGALQEQNAEKPFLVCCEFVSETKSGMIVRIVNDSVRWLDPQFDGNRVKLLLTDAAPYCVKAGKSLKELFPKMIHVTCLAHGLHRVAEKVRESFPLVNRLIASGKKIFVKAPLRRDAFKVNCPDIPFPPEPVITRWGTWLEAAIYYADNFEVFDHVVQLFDPNDSIAIQECQDILTNHQVKADLAFIKCNL